MELKVDSSVEDNRNCSAEQIMKMEFDERFGEKRRKTQTHNWRG
jgi:hypothetical protein